MLPNPAMLPQPQKVNVAESDLRDANDALRERGRIRPRVRKPKLCQARLDSPSGCVILGIKPPAKAVGTERPERINEQMNE
jgi:hypothetical protein